MQKAEDKMPICIDGKMACPEDCGGIYGYEELIQVINNKKHLEYKEMADWLGGSFDTEKFDINNINRRLQKAR